MKNRPPKIATIDECCRLLGWSRRTWFRRVNQMAIDHPGGICGPIPGSWPYLYDVAEVEKWAKSGPRSSGTRKKST